MKVLLVDDTVVIPVVTSIINLFFNRRRVLDPAQNDADFGNCLDSNTIYDAGGSIVRVIFNFRNCQKGLTNIFLITNKKKTLKNFKYLSALIIQRKVKYESQFQEFHF